MAILHGSWVDREAWSQETHLWSLVRGRPHWARPRTTCVEWVLALHSPRGAMVVCGLNLSLPVSNHTCSSGQLAYGCTCDVAIFCCQGEDCACFDRKESGELFSFSWPLVAGWYTMLVVLFCFGRRGRFVCGGGRPPPATAAEGEAVAEASAPPRVKTRRLGEKDVAGGTDCEAPPRCARRDPPRRQHRRYDLSLAPPDRGHCRGTRLPSPEPPKGAFFARSVRVPEESAMGPVRETRSKTQVPTCTTKFV